MLTTCGDRADVGSLQDWRYVCPADSTAAVVGVQDDRFEGALAKAVGRQPRVAEHRPWPVPWLAEVQLYHGPKGQSQ